MMADHGNPCSAEDATYCMNGGTCYKISSMDTLSCVCNPNYKGSRCEQFQLGVTQPISNEAGLIAAVIVITLLILMVLGFIVYYIRKMLKAKEQRQQNHNQEYWKVQSRA
ncbi:hypothetical protein ACER0C_005511 [Sarotherodon galilaeus]